MIDKLNKIFHYDHKKYENFLDDENNKLSIIINEIFNFLLLLFVLILVIESLDSFSIYFKRSLWILDCVISFIFAFEYIYRFLRAPDKAKFVFSFSRIIDLLSFLPFFLGFFLLSDFVKVIRLLRAIRVISFIRSMPLTHAFLHSFTDYKKEYTAVFTLFTAVLFIWSFSVYFSERNVPDTHFTSIPMTLWWGLVTMTTVWFGDMYPITPLGKFLWSIIVFLWPVMLALNSAVMIMVFMDTARKEKFFSKYKKWKKCGRCSIHNEEKANYCIMCGKKFNLISENKK